MRNKKVVIVTSVSLVLIAAQAWGASRMPVPVSPGAAQEVASVGDGCPTFSWGAAAGALDYDLAVYRIGETGVELELVLRQKIPGTASSWTPSLDRCLDRGGRYAWSIRATRKRGASDWSSPSLFQVASSPGLQAVDEALSPVHGSSQGLKSRAKSTAPDGTPSAVTSDESGRIVTSDSSAAPPPDSGVVIAEDTIWINGDQVVTFADTFPTCRRVDGLLWCYDDSACGEACNDVCSALGLVPIAGDTVWFAAQDTLAECNAISEAFGLGMTAVLVDWTFACLEDDFGTHAVDGGLLAPLRCTTDSSCPSAHRTGMDQFGVACGPGSRRSICPCESAS